MLLFALSHKWTRDLMYKAAQKRIEAYLESIRGD
jgi:hypothetical protein